METASTYFTRRARQERAKAADANSAEARMAHLELAFRLVRVTTQYPSWRDCPENMSHGTPTHESATLASNDLENVLSVAIPLPSTDAFEGLLDALETSTPTGA